MLKKPGIIVCIFLLAFIVYAQTAGDFVYVIEESGLWIMQYNGKAAKLTIPAKIDGKQVMAINGMAFYENQMLTNLVISEGITAIIDGRIIEDQRGNKILYGAFDRCIKLSSVKLPASLEYIGIGAFQNCFNLTSITIPKGVINIGEQAFASSGLKKFAFNGKIETINASTFQRCASLTSVNMTGVEKIEPYAFMECITLKDITLPPTIKEIWNSSFAGCKSLTTVKIPSSVKNLVIAEGAFSGCPLNAASIALLKKYGYDHK